jgi:acetyltransferase-like isoleucine patch superfamily enzyme
MCLAFLLFVLGIPRRILNNLLNKSASIITGARVSIDWSDVKIIGHRRISFGPNFSCGRSLWLESVQNRGIIDIGANVNMSDFVHIAAFNSVTISDGVLIGSKVLITDHSHGHTRGAKDLLAPNIRPLMAKGPIKIEANAWIGDGACILSNVTVGSGAIVGANSVVSSNIPPHSIWVGAPARQIWPESPSFSQNS